MDDYSAPPGDLSTEGDAAADARAVGKLLERTRTVAARSANGILLDEPKALRAKRAALVSACQIVERAAEFVERFGPESAVGAADCSSAETPRTECRHTVIPRSRSAMPGLDAMGRRARESSAHMSLT